MNRSLPLALLFAALGVLVLVGCSDDSDSDDAAGDQEVVEEDDAASDEELVEGVEMEVLTVDNYFRPEVVSVVAGTEVVWVNKGQTAHDIIPVEDGEFYAAPEDLEPGDEYRYRFTEAGTYPYYCSLHGNEEVGMVGTIEVTAP